MSPWQKFNHKFHYALRAIPFGVLFFGILLWKARPANPTGEQEGVFFGLWLMCGVASSMGGAILDKIERCNYKPANKYALVWYSFIPIVAAAVGATVGGFAASLPFQDDVGVALIVGAWGAWVGMLSALWLESARDPEAAKHTRRGGILTPLGWLVLIAILAIAVIAALSIELPNYETNWRWQSLATDGEGPGPRFQATGFCYEDGFYVLGGNTGPDRKDHSMALFRYDLKERRWENRATSGPKPSPRSGATSLLLPDRLILLGGYWDGGPDGLGRAVDSMDVFTLDLKSWKWSKLISHGDVPSPRWGSGIATNGDDIWVYAGDDNWTVAYQEIYRLKVKGNEAHWNRIEMNLSATEDRTSSAYPALLYNNGQLLKLLGDGGMTGIPREVWRGTPTDKELTWEIVKVEYPPDPEPEDEWDNEPTLAVGMVGGFAQLENRVIFFGPTLEGLGHKHLDQWDALALNFPTEHNPSLKWSIIKPQNKPDSQEQRRIGHVVAQWGESLVVFGGRIGDFEMADNTVWLLSPVEDEKR